MTHERENPLFEKNNVQKNELNSNLIRNNSENESIFIIKKN